MKKLIHKDGNLLLATDVDVIGHQANCQNTFGSGIARTILQMYPEAYAADTGAAVRKINILGSFSCAKVSTKQDSSIKAIFNLYGQNLGTGPSRNPIRKTNYEALYNALEGLRNAVEHGDGYLSDVKNGRVAFPYKMGSALGGGSWDVVERLIEVAFDGYNNDVIIYKFEP
jgi:O-acetyl-ADP-ribose deacetylase (regulator of RNase III)